MKNITKKISVFVPGIVSAVSFGMIPLFAKPLLDDGIDRATTLTYRMLISAFAIMLISLGRQISLKVNSKEILHLFLGAVLYYLSASCLFASYSSMDTGLATILHFLYPVFVTLIMHFVYKQYISIFTIIAILLSIVGVTMISLSTMSDISNIRISLYGLISVIASAIAYALYIVKVNKTKELSDMNSLKISFYVLAIAGIFFLFESSTKGTFKLLDTGYQYFNAISLALIATLLSNLTLISSINKIGSTLTSVLGASEAVTAVLIGIIVFGENFNTILFLGMILIILAVILIILSPIFDKRILSRIKDLYKSKKTNYTNCN